MSDSVITVENLGKRYRIRHQAERQRYVALRDVLADKTKSAARRLWSLLCPARHLGSPSNGSDQPNSTTPAAPRNEAVDALKGLAIIGVIFAHISFQSRLSATNLAKISVVQRLFGWCVLAFFFCAGRLTRIGQTKERGWLDFALKRAKRLLLPCVVFSVTYKACLLVIYHLFHLGQPGRFTPVSVSYWLAFVLVPVGPQFYFLPYLFVVSLVAL
ncbi:MAG: acyltransferase, partial [Verrucomicrobia bacterium]|nr:acyltransferase [Verrucomicrobiota bacterium]